MDGFYSGTGNLCQWKNDPDIGMVFRFIVPEKLGKYTRGRETSKF
jgi:hypothetical protein